jgi:hypothetical protein
MKQILTGEAAAGIRIPTLKSNRAANILRT